MSMPKLLTVDEVAALLHAPRSSVLSWVYTGKLASVKAGRKRLVTEAAVLAYLGIAPAAPPANVLPLPTPSKRLSAKRPAPGRRVPTP